MNDFHGLLSSDFGFKPQGKSAPMAPPKPNPNPNFTDPDSLFHRPQSSTANSTPAGSDFDDIFGTGVGNSRSTTTTTTAVNFDSIFDKGGSNSNSNSRFSSLPVFDKPVYDDEVGDVDDVFAGVDGLKNSSSGRFDDGFRSMGKKESGGDVFDEILGSVGRKGDGSKGSSGRDAGDGIPAFDDLLPGFGGGATERTSSSSSWRPKSSESATNRNSNIIDDPFVVLESNSSPAPPSAGFYDDPLEQIGNLNNFGSKKVDPSTSGAVFDDIDPLEGLGKSVPASSSEFNDIGKDGSPSRTEHSSSGRHTFTGADANASSSVKSPDRAPPKKSPAEDYRGSSENVFDIPPASDFQRSVPDTSPPPYADRDANFNEKSFQENVSPRSQDIMDSTDDIWLTVSEVPLFTQPTAAPPPSRPPPPKPAQFSRGGPGYFAPHAKKKVEEYSAFPGSTTSFQSPRSPPVGAKNLYVSPIDELEDFAMGKGRNHIDGSSDVLPGEDMDANSVAAASAAAMKEAMDKAEAKFKHAKEVRERENAKVARMQQDRGERTTHDAQERELRERRERLDQERLEKEMEEEEKRRREEEERRRIERERELKEREQKRLEKERQQARQAVERATREARERAAADARARAERAAVEKAQAEARERAERAAVHRAQAEARERAARDAKEKAEKAAAEARERARAQAREKDAQEKAAAAAAAAARASQQQNNDDLESFFGMGSRANSAPRPRASSSDPFFDAQFQSKQTQDDVGKSTASSANMRKASSSTNIVDDLSDIFGGPPSSGQFQEVEGETGERRRARLERHQRTQERAAKALAEKNQRDLQAQREQAERHRFGETTDIEIKRWAAGKEGNLRALLSTLQYVLWPESGWQAVSLTDLITAASVKKVYRKATLCIHPDKVQQKGASLQQKYVAEKVFDILKEAWNKFNSEELF